MEAQFTARRATTESTKYGHAVAQLPLETATELIGVQLEYTFIVFSVLGNRSVGANTCLQCQSMSADESIKGEFLVSKVPTKVLGSSVVSVGKACRMPWARVLVGHILSLGASNNYIVNAVVCGRSK